MGVIGLLLVFSSFVVNQESIILYYPVLISLCLLIFFISSYFYPPTVIEKIARLTDKDFDDKAVPYTEKVTLVWCGFFLINALIAVYTVYSKDLELWTLYNGLISYLIMGLIFCVEFLIRQKVEKSNES